MASIKNNIRENNSGSMFWNHDRYGRQVLSWNTPNQFMFARDTLNRTYIRQNRTFGFISHLYCSLFLLRFFCSSQFSRATWWLIRKKFQCLENSKGWRKFFVGHLCYFHVAFFKRYHYQFKPRHPESKQIIKILYNS